jgi:hypothetical protein
MLIIIYLIMLNIFFIMHHYDHSIRESCFESCSESCSEASRIVGGVTFYVEQYQANQVGVSSMPKLFFILPGY